MYGDFRSLLSCVQNEIFQLALNPSVRGVCARAKLSSSQGWTLGHLHAGCSQPVVGLGSRVLRV